MSNNRSNPIQKITEIDYIEQRPAGISGAGLGSGLNMGGAGLGTGLGGNLTNTTGAASTAMGTVGTGLGPNLIGLPHVKVNPECRKCHGTAWNSVKGRECRKCVCHKCGGSGFRTDKNLPCKKIKTGLL